MSFNRTTPTPHSPANRSSPTVGAATGGLLTPPGGMLIWMFSALEMLTFGAGFVVFLVKRAGDPEAFATAQATLNPTVAVANTVVLVASGYVVAQGVLLHQVGRSREAARRFFGGAVLGLTFLVIKGTEYFAKLAAGLGPESGTFFSFYWLLTGFHFLHVTAGVMILLGMASFTSKGKVAKEADFGIETGATFWHLCDLIWIFLFPLLYILR